MTPTQRWLVLGVVYFLFLAIGIAALLAAIGLLPSANPRFADWAIGVLVVDVTAAALTVFKAHLGGREARLYVNVLFEGMKPSDINLDHCTFVVYDGDHAVKKKGRASVISGPGGWQCQFSWPAESSDTAQLELVEHGGRTWKIRSFSPTTVEQRAYTA